MAGTSGHEDNTGQDAYKIRHMETVHAGLLVLGIAASTLLLGSNIDAIFTFMGSTVAYVLGTEYTHYPAAYPYWDAFTTSASLAAMYLMARRYVESWVLWTIVNIVCVVLYFHKGVIAMSAEYLVFLANSVYGLYQWNKSAK